VDYQNVVITIQNVVITIHRMFDCLIVSLLPHLSHIDGVMMSVFSLSVVDCVFSSSVVDCVFSSSVVDCVFSSSVVRHFDSPQ
jgi:hypothetical protein